MRPVVFAALLLVAACRQPVPPEEVLEAPFRAQYGDFAIAVPDRADFYQTRHYSFGFTGKICHRAHRDYVPLCEDMASPVVGDFGVQTFIRQPLPTARFHHLKERPPGGARPRPIPLVPLAGPVDTSPRGDGESYYIGRLTSPDNKVLLTTSRRWPIANCADAPQGHRRCSVAFLIKSAFVEASWHAKDGVELNQAEVWDVASALDAKLRSLEVDAPISSQTSQ